MLRVPASVIFGTHSQALADVVTGIVLVAELETRLQSTVCQAAFARQKNLSYRLFTCSYQTPHATSIFMYLCYMLSFFRFPVLILLL